jgi:RNA polymerase I-specific transcription initiation factor RRN7
VDIYVAARKLGRILELDYSFPNTLGRHTVTANPEIQIISLIIIATKLCQPFDDIARVPESVTDPSGLKLDWEAWSDIMAEKLPKGLKRGQEISVTDGDVFKMKGKELDDYLDWYHRTWVDDSDPKCKSTKCDQLYYLSKKCSC